MERGLFADLAIVHAWKGDTAGNLVYRKTARNFNPMMATAAKVTVAEVEHLVPAGETRSGPHPYARHFRQAHHRGRHRQEADRIPQHAPASRSRAGRGNGE